MKFKIIFITVFLLANVIHGVVPNSVTLQNVLEGKFSARGFGGSWVSDNELEFGKDGHIYTYNVLKNEEVLAFNGSIFDDGIYKWRSISYSPDRNFILITHSSESVWRHSTKALFDVYYINQNKTEKITPSSSAGEQEKLSLFRWAPTAGNGFAFVFDNNIYYRKRTEIGENYFQLTFDGEKGGSISNGFADWVYEEEMFASSNGLWFSPDSSHLAFIKFNDAKVGEFQYPIYGEPGDNSKNAYPTWIDLYYPKAGTNNPTVELYYVNLKDSNPTPKKFNYDKPQNDGHRHYIATVEWLTPTRLLVIHLNRLQNHANSYACDTGTGVCTWRFEQKSEDGWIDVYTPLVSANGEDVLTIFPEKIERNKKNETWRQIFKININNAETAVAEAMMEASPISVSSILAWDEANKTIYYSGTGLHQSKEGQQILKPSESQIYKSIEKGAPACITCDLTNKDKVQCGANGVSFSPAFTYFLHSCRGPGIPEYVVRENKDKYPIVSTLQNNTELRKNLEDVKLPIVKDYSIPSSNSTFNIDIRLHLPPDLDEDAIAKYPLFIDVYAGPNSQAITDGFSINWGTSLVTDKKVIYGSIDGRGASGRTTEHYSQIYKRLGTVEIEDQIAATKYLVKNLPFIDPERVGIWGWSYGGYATSMALAKDTENVFKCGIAVAPVTSWYFYDTIYTEKFMRLPTKDDNLQGYENGDVTTNVENFRKKEFLLVHGNADDNVHFQQSMILSRALEKADIMFDQLSYPDEAHGISSVRRHLYHSFEKFLFRQCLKAEKTPSEGDATTPGGGNRNNLSLIFVVMATILCRIAVF